jgi:hypothetical protein
MPDQLLIYSIENSLMIISINCLSWVCEMVIKIAIDYGELVKVAQKRGGGKRSGWMG